jgi:hypothetical protein
LQFEDTEIPAAAVHSAFITALADGYASVMSASELLVDEGAEAAQR